MPVSVLLADDSEVMRRAIRKYLDCQRDIVVVGEAVNFSETVRLAERLRPQVVLMDLHMKDTAGADAPAIAPTLVSMGAKIVAISLNVNDETKLIAKQIGAATLLDKMFLHSALVPLILELTK